MWSKSRAVDFISPAVDVFACAQIMYRHLRIGQPPDDFDELTLFSAYFGRKESQLERFL